MSALSQTAAVTAMNFRSLPARLGTSSVVVIGIAGVVGVIVSIFGLTRGLSGVLAETGSPERAIVLRAGATSEGSSSLAPDSVLTIENAPGVLVTSDGGAAATADLLVAVSLVRKEDGTATGVTVRGVEPSSAAVRPEMRLVAGRMFKPGIRELIVGKGAYAEFRGVEIGDRVGLRDGGWTIVGVFESGGDAHESRLVADADTLLSAYQRTAVNSVTVRLQSAAAFDEFKTALTTNPALSVTVERESDYYARQSEQAGGFFDFIAYFVGGIMALGALFAALNTMYSAVSTRAVEIATLRAIGYGAGSVVTSVLLEALLLALLGALLGAAVAWLLFSGNTISMGNGNSSLVFEMRVTPALLGVGVLWACAVGFIGGLFPAVRAARVPVATALRAV